jgi:transcriptional regulator with XRE-family HTH domain
LSADTIRRLESYGCSPRVDTLNRLSKGLGMATSSLLEGYENGQRNEARELIDLITSASPKAIRILTKLARLMIAELDGPAVEEPTADVEPAEDDDEDDEP